MTDYSDATTAKHATLSANIVDRVTLTGDAFEILRRADAGEIYVRFGTDPTVAGNDCYVVTNSPLVIPRTTGGQSTVRLISSSALAYSVTAVPKR